MSREVTVLPAKIDAFHLHHAPALEALMHDNGAFIQLPSLGSGGSMLSVFADSKVAIERTIRGLMKLAESLVQISIYIRDASPSPKPLVVPAAITAITAATGASVTSKPGLIELIGEMDQVKSAAAAIMALPAMRSLKADIRVQIELANDHREFVAGKKNGKVNKIQQMCAVSITFNDLSHYNFLLTMSTASVDVLLIGLDALQAEMPAEISFVVPEAFHKRIIGVGGKNIQKIMKQYGVYVKFLVRRVFTPTKGIADTR